MKIEKSDCVMRLGLVDRFRRRESGAVLIELSLVAPMLIITFIAIAQFSFAFYVDATLQSATRAAVRFASMGGGITTADTYTTCTSVAPNSVESNACDYIANTNLFGLLGDFEVKAGTYAGNDGGTGSDTTDDTAETVRVYARVLLSDVVFIDFRGLLGGGRYIESFSAMVVQP
ncbi:MULTISPECIES: TadE/TadG family type IV pilus assembly protein [Limibacillus]|jgi:Flp pilus assembly protein TadG|uniref:Flp pilus assembly protein TadG n=1 Tax=Limibacillus halophilus TaxID=1579333 RepID=A0A839SVR0_9PROT|nr:TadE family protein [Limibacillus halophilus]MBB3065576.1 Flp pilus assembly protein TadG [Limibacillus halophilus]